jgi:hypothetical protein
MMSAGIKAAIERRQGVAARSPRSAERSRSVIVLGKSTDFQG